MEAAHLKDQHALTLCPCAQSLSQTHLCVLFVVPRMPARPCHPTLSVSALLPQVFRELTKTSCVLPHILVQTDCLTVSIHSATARTFDLNLKKKPKN